MELDTDLKCLPADLKYIKVQCNELILEGQGSILLEEEKTIKIKIFVSKTTNFNKTENFERLFNKTVKAGQVMGKDTYFTFEGCSFSDLHFNCESVFLDYFVEPTIINGRIVAPLFITDSRDFSNYNIGKVVIPYKIKLPTNKPIRVKKEYSDKWINQIGSLSIFETSVNETDIDIFNENEKTIILFQSSTKYFDYHNDVLNLIDTLAFLTSTIIEQYWVEIHNNRKSTTKYILFYPSKKAKNIQKGFAPISINSSAPSKDYSNLFNSFFKYRVKEDSEDLMRTLRQIINSSDSYAAVYALTLTTYIELVVKKYFKDYAKTFSSQKMSEAIGNVNDLKIDTEIKKRILGLLNNIKGEIRAKDILNELVAKKIISKRQLHNWNKLRNSSTHGDHLDTPFQELFNLCSANLVLYYHLIFHLIKYNGSYTDYSIYGYPLKSIE